jgi:capsular polysaccharide biosynthesis protein
MRKWWLFLICGIVGGVIFFAVTANLITPIYQSSAMLYVLSKTTSITSLTDLSLGASLTEDFTIIAKSNPVLDGAIKRIEEESGKVMTREEISDMLTVSNTASRMLEISAVSDEPKVAALVANAVADETVEQMAEITKTDPPTVVETAEPAQEPVSPNVGKNTLLGLLLGICLAGLVVTIGFLLNDHIITEDDVEKYLGLPTLATIPESKNAARSSKKKKSRRKR